MIEEPLVLYVYNLYCYSDKSARGCFCKNLEYIKPAIFTLFVYRFLYTLIRNLSAVVVIVVCYIILLFQVTGNELFMGVPVFLGPTKT